MKTRGTLIRTHPLTETSLIVRWCTGEHGLLKTVAKGARRPRSAFAGKLDLFFHCEIEVRPSRSSDLHLLTEARLEKPRLGLRRDYLTTLAASYFVRMVDRAAEPEDPIPEIAGLMERGLDHLDGSAPSLRALLHFEKELARHLGVLETGISPHLSLQQLCGDLPPQREELLARLERSPETP